MMSVYYAQAFFFAKWQDDVIAMTKLARDPAVYLELIPCVTGAALTFRVQVVR